MSPRQIGCFPVVGIVFSCALVGLGVIYPLHTFDFASRTFQTDWGLSVRLVGSGLAIYALILLYLRLSSDS